MAVRKTRKPGTKAIGWIRDTVLRIYTEDQLKADWNAIEPVERIKTLSSWVPKVVENKGESGMTVVFNLRGVREEKVIKAHMDALPEHDTE